MVMLWLGPLDTSRYIYDILCLAFGIGASCLKAVNKNIIQYIIYQSHTEIVYNATCAIIRLPTSSRLEGSKSQS